MLQVAGLIFAISSLASDWQYARGTQSQTIAAIGYLRNAATLAPYDWMKRSAAARKLAITALQNKSPEVLEAARLELLYALRTDYTSGDLLGMLIIADLMLERNEEAQFYYDRFKLVDKKSPLIELVKRSHQEASHAVAGEP